MDEDFPAHSMDSIAARRGLFDYEQLWESLLSGPYGRVHTPKVPLHVDQLPPDLREAVTQMRFDLCFAQTVHIQPVEHAPCDSWETEYLSSDGHTQAPIPARRR